MVEQIIDPDYYADPQNDYIYILCEAELVALKIFATPEVLLAAEETGIKPGTTFTEESCGTNALALAREHNRLLAIRGEQHHCKLFKNWWCVASPVKDHRGNTIGYLAISIQAEKELVSTNVLLKTLVKSIENEFSQLNSNQVNRSPQFPPTLPPEIERELTPREREVLALLCNRLTTKEIAERLHLSPFTVENLPQAYLSEAQRER